MSTSNNRQLTTLFERAAKILDLKGAVAFKAIAFQKVARVLENLPRDVEQVHDDGGVKALQAIDGIGASSAAIIADWITTGESKDLKELEADVPEGLPLLLDVPGLGPKTVRLLWLERGIIDAASLEAAIDDGTLEGLRGVGAKKIEQIREGLAIRANLGRRLGRGVGRKVAAEIVGVLRGVAGVQHVEPAGSLRRGRETLGDLDVLVGADPGDARGILEAFTAWQGVARVLGKGDTKVSILTHDKLQVDCRVVPAASWGAALVYFTGSKEHNVRLRTMALERGHTLNEWGVYPVDTWEKLDRKPGEVPSLKSKAGASEQDVYAWLKLAWIPPELREDRGEIEAATAGTLPELLTRESFRGDLHTHTTASDGTASIEEMALAAKALGYTFLAITDHSPSQRQANGLDARRLLKHAAEVRRIGEQVKGITLLAGSEVDILADGRLDYPDDVLTELDWVVASPHTALRQEGDKATDRLLHAIDNPYVNVIGHPTGRLINARAGITFDAARVFDAAAKAGVAMEINASDERLDLSDTMARQAVAAGCTLCIDTDAHSTGGLDNLEGGIATARRAWVTDKDVLNTRTITQVRRFVSRRRPR